jgi:hypothetical protein
MMPSYKYDEYKYRGNNINTKPTGKFGEKYFGSLNLMS